ncbi:hypothetical protein FWF89_02925 [Candidatus Saccharibacteria bacterium]|nr:hypothetical protein [Candidatus Saccharibacteria bacterium]
MNNPENPSLKSKVEGVVGDVGGEKKAMTQREKVAKIEKTAPKTLEALGISLERLKADDDSGMSDEEFDKKLDKLVGDIDRWEVAKAEERAETVRRLKDMRPSELRALGLTAEQVIRVTMKEGDHGDELDEIMLILNGAGGKPAGTEVPKGEATELTAEEEKERKRKRNRKFGRTAAMLALVGLIGLGLSSDVAKRDATPGETNPPIVWGEGDTESDFEADRELLDTSGYVGFEGNGIFANQLEDGTIVNNPEKISEVAYAEALFLDGRRADRLSLNELADMGATPEGLYDIWLNGRDGTGMDGAFWMPSSLAPMADVLTADELTKFGITSNLLNNWTVLEDYIEDMGPEGRIELGRAIKAHLDNREKSISKIHGNYLTTYVRPVFKDGRLVSTELVQCRGNGDRTVLVFGDKEIDPKTGEVISGGGGEKKIFVTCTQPVGQEGRTEVVLDEEPDETPPPKDEIDIDDPEDEETPPPPEEETPPPPEEETPPPPEEETPPPPEEETPPPPPKKLEGKDETLTNHEVIVNNTPLPQDKPLTEKPAVEEYVPPRVGGSEVEVGEGGGPGLAVNPITGESLQEGDEVPTPELGPQQRPPVFSEETNADKVDGATVVSEGDGLPSTPGALPVSEGDSRDTDLGGASDSDLANRFGDRFGP